MDQNVLSPEQRRSLQVFQYNNINSVTDNDLTTANTNLAPVLASMKTQNDMLLQKTNTLQTLLDTVKQPSNDNDVLLEEIRWNTYFYKKYHHQTQMMGIIIAVCVLINVLHLTLSKMLFIAGTGFILSVAFVIIVYLFWDLTMRDNLNFDEYSFYNYRGEYSRHNLYTNQVTDASNCRLNKVVDYYA